jgi:hypothetical protein
MAHKVSTGDIIKLWFITHFFFHPKK